MSIPLESLPDDLRLACTRLRDELGSLLGPELVALWAYGAAIRPDRPRRLGDVDTHGVLRSTPDQHTAAKIDELHEEVARELGVELDSWYILEADARGAQPPRHAVQKELVDGWWSLHRAHWVAGEYVVLHGCPAADLVRPPTWPEIEDGLRYELAFITSFVEEGKSDSGHAAYAISNACRIIYSLSHRDVVISKRAATLWALEHMPASWQPAIRAAIRVYDAEDDDDDARVLKTSMQTIVAAAQGRLD